MEALLNKLIEKGWKPFWWEVREAKKWSYDNLYYWFDTHPELYHIRMLVSNESWLWQFVCENGMVVRKRQWTNRWWWEPENCFDYKDYQYRIIESALCNEEDLEKFLLENIKIS